MSDDFTDDQEAEDEVVYCRRVDPRDKRFEGRNATITSMDEYGELDQIIIPVQVLVCHGCNGDFWSDIQDRKAYLVYLSKGEMEADHEYDIYCESCVKYYFPTAQEVV